jgi:hypothetical protein
MVSSLEGRLCFFDPKSDVLPFPASFARELPRRFRIADENFVRRIPLQSATEAIPDIHEVTDRGAPVTDLGRANRRFRFADPIEPIGVVIVGGHDSSGIVTERFLEN